ncbi:hypothetical protein [Streptomyces sp. NPDC045714]|uniref:hypothetical protein n=1 Tax=Streptomyces sp. NPDC045714 TaxID=3154913 RepID=UPI0033CECB0F
MPTTAEVEEYVDIQLGRAAAGKLAPYAQVDPASGRVLGATAYGDPRSWPDRRVRLEQHIARGPAHRQPAPSTR